MHAEVIQCSAKPASVCRRTLDLEEPPLPIGSLLHSVASHHNDKRTQSHSLGPRTAGRITQNQTTAILQKDLPTHSLTQQLYPAASQCCSVRRAIPRHHSASLFEAPKNDSSPSFCILALEIDMTQDGLQGMAPTHPRPSPPHAHPPWP